MKTQKAEGRANAGGKNDVRDDENEVKRIYLLN